ncbi:thiamine-phosphate kinase [Uliginosibacterium sp. H3]|uniref:Thiamine-monophosphate kinase n=1 Tax=Uliginosibacterium silvisoli TaxID=3114758 RepID=A0ABU6K2B7_9RHOO|nr:thiamine-phosphate kinase [Uliginosibacterium sp. H3]
MAGEFDLIRRHFARATQHTDLGVGDDGALLRTRPGMQLVVSSDMLVSGTHFFPDAEPEALGWKTAAANISDMAAMAAEPRWITLALALPESNDKWVEAFANGFSACCTSFGVDWIGGDTTRGPLNLCATVFGEVPHGQAVVRSGARAGDELWISGTPGLAALGLQHLLGNIELPEGARTACLSALHRPQPRVALGLALRGVATAMLDVSDGLLGDLGHILERSNCGALIEDALLPLAPVLSASGDEAQARRALLSGGDDYELLFAAPLSQRQAVLDAAQRIGLPVTRIGAVTDQANVILLQGKDGARSPLAARGFDHFGS